MFKGIGTNEKVVIELLCTKNGAEIKHLAQTYSRCKFEKHAENLKRSMFFYVDFTEIRRFFYFSS